MPAKYGQVKRAAVLKDTDEFKRNINIYVISESSTGKLIKSNATLKNNLKNWLLHYKMISDTIDILDPTIVNYAVEYEVMTGLGSNRFEVINRCTDALAAKLTFVQDIGESLGLAEMYRALQKVEGVIDVSSLEVKLRAGNLYSQSNYDFEGALSSNGKEVLASTNIIFELKYPNLDLIGSVR